MTCISLNNFFLGTLKLQVKRKESLEKKDEKRMKFNLDKKKCATLARCVSYWYV